jgi:hypothetical protein
VNNSIVPQWKFHVYQIYLRQWTVPNIVFIVSKLLKQTLENQFFSCVKGEDLLPACSEHLVWEL